MRWRGATRAPHPTGELPGRATLFGVGSLIVLYSTEYMSHDRDYRRGTTIKFDKGTEPKYIELRIKDSLGKLQPEFDVKVWQ